MQIDVESAYNAPMTNTLHAHVSTASADCDGPMYDSWVETFNDDETAEYEAAIARGGYNDFSDIHFMDRVFVSRCSPYAVGQLTIKVDDDGFEYDEATEEGYRRGEVRWCRDESCDPNRKTHRDVYAEQMGY